MDMIDFFHPTSVITLYVDAVTGNNFNKKIT